MRRLKKLFSLGLLAAVLSCSASAQTAAPKKPKLKIKQPRVEVPETWSTLPTEGISTQVAQLKEWWKNFRDPRLDTLVEQALLANLDLRIADARLREARARRGVAHAARYPTLDQ